MTEQTPLEQLTAMTTEVTKRKKAKPVDPTDKIERFYRAQLTSLVRAMSKEVKQEILPVIKREQALYTSDAYTMDGWADRILEALAGLIAKYTGPILQQQYQRVAKQTVSMAEADTTQEFLDSVNNAVGVDLNPMLGGDGMKEYLDIATANNLSLIKSVPEQYFNRVEQAVMGGVRDGDSLTTIARNIQQSTGITERRAKLIARDQSAKLHSEIAERRSNQAGIKYYKVVTAGDRRVSGKPGGKYPNAKISCWGIANRDIGYGKGVYSWSKGASWGGKTGLHPGKHHVNCRCTSTPVFEWELPGNKS